MAAEKTEIYLKSLQLTNMVARKIAGYDHRYKYFLGTQSFNTCVDLTRDISLGLSRRGTSNKMRYYDRAEESIASLKTMLVVANEIDILSVEDKAKIDVMVESVEGQLKAVVSSLKASQIDAAERPCQRT